MSRNLIITAADGQTGHLISELLLTDDTFTSKISEITCVTLHPEKCEDLKELGAVIIVQKPGDLEGLVSAMESSTADTIFFIPPAHKDKLELSKEMLEATRQANIKNTVLLSAAGIEFADAKKQPKLCEFLEIEALFMESKGLSDTDAGTSACIIRAGFYAENLLLYNKDVQRNNKLRLPIGTTHSFAPVALGDIAQVAARVLVAQGPKGLDDKHRGQLIILTGPRLIKGPELPELVKQVGMILDFDDISPNEAKELLDEDTDVDDSEKQYLLEYYSLVREGKTNYVSTIAFNAITGGHPMDIPEFFKIYDADFKPKRRKTRSSR